MKRLPLTTLAIITASVAVYLVEMSGDGMATCERLGFVPDRFLRTGGILSVLVYPLLHDPSSVMHLIGNVALLALFGPLVERQLGALRVLGVYVASGIAGAFGHWLVAPGATDPLVGNSGCVFALLAIAATIDPRTLGFTALLFMSNLVALVYPSPWLVSAGTSVGCHIGGFVAGAGTALLASVRGDRWAIG